MRSRQRGDRNRFGDASGPNLLVFVLSLEKVSKSVGLGLFSIIKKHQAKVTVKLNHFGFCLDTGSVLLSIFVAQRNIMGFRPIPVTSMECEVLLDSFIMVLASILTH
jgi:hypothetical protein